jgi:hypothetical protein
VFEELKIRIRQRGIDVFGTVHVVQLEMPMIDYDTDGVPENVEALIRKIFEEKFPGAVQDPFTEVDRDTLRP